MAIDHNRVITERVVSAIRAGTGPFALPWTKHFALPIRLDGTPYQGVNILSLWVAAQQASFRACQWGGFQGWRTQGGAVRRGEHGTRIVFVRPIEREGNAGERERFLIGRSWTVFCRDQIDGLADEPAATHALADETVVQAVEQVARCAGIGFQVRGQQAMYRIAHDDILMPGQDLFHDTETQSAARHYASTLAHELIQYAVSQIMPHGRVLRVSHLRSVMRRIGIIRTTGTPRSLVKADWRLAYAQASASKGGPN